METKCPYCQATYNVDIPEPEQPEEVVQEQEETVKDEEEIL